MATDSADEFEAHRGRLFGLAYRMLGSATNAEDVVQDAYLRFSGADRAAIAAPSAWLTKVVTNLCLNQLTSARARREHYVGPWLPEPVLTADGALGPLDRAELRESVSLGLLRLLERLSPTERAVFVLREAFSYSHRDIAEFAGLSETNSRQVHRRARKAISADTGSHPVEHAHWTDLLERFLAAAGDGDLDGLHQLLAEDVVSVADGGGEVGAARRPVAGKDRVARYLIGLVQRFAGDMDVEISEVNGRPAVLALAGGQLTGLFLTDVTDGMVSGVYIVASPSKLRFAARQLGAVSHP